MGLPSPGEPGGDFYMWCELPHRIRDNDFSRLAAERGILLAPASAFDPGDHAPHPPCG